MFCLVSKKNSRDRNFADSRNMEPANSRLHPNQPAGGGSAPKAEILGAHALGHRQIVEAAELVAIRDDRRQIRAHDVGRGARREAVVRDRVGRVGAGAKPALAGTLSARPKIGGRQQYAKNGGRNSSQCGKQAIER